MARHRASAATQQGSRFRRPGPRQSCNCACPARPVPVAGKPLIARAHGGRRSADADVLILRGVARRLGMTEHLAAGSEELQWVEQPRQAVADAVIPQSRSASE